LAEPFINKLQELSIKIRLMFMYFVLRMDNYAEKLFKSMEDKNSRSYDAMILALLKVVKIILL
jgi:hypothetical protein